MITKRSKVLLTGLLFVICQLASCPAGAQSFRIDTISDAVFQRMQGLSFPEHCTVPRQQLRHLHVLHRNAEDSVCQGELICHERIADDLLDIFQQLYDAHYPIERIQLIDEYGADDEVSMSANNTSCFCFRTVEGSNKLSKHAQGLAIDINPLYNPCVRRRTDGIVHITPAAGKQYADRNRQSPYRLRRGDLCYRLFLKHGFIWGGSWRTVKDYQHFEK